MVYHDIYIRNRLLIYARVYATYEIIYENRCLDLITQKKFKNTLNQ